MDKKHYSQTEIHKEFIAECRQLIKKSSVLSERLDRKIELLLAEKAQKKLH
ncbi:hypothetical protein RYR54_001702 [Aeromonas sobria]|nr:hypothetical protein [Aeromonas sobria]